MSVLESELTITTPSRLDQDGVRRLFLETFAMGSPMPFVPYRFDLYCSMSLDWYLDEGHVVVAKEDGEVVGYAMLCPNEKRLNRWLLPRAIRLLVVVVIGVVAGRVDSPSRRFYWLRFRDSLRIVLGRRSGTEGVGAHVHLNVARAYRSGSVAARLLEAIDQVCRDLGVEKWLGEMNAMPRTRRRALGRLFGDLVDEQPNLTFSWLAGSTVSRLTFRRRVPVPGVVGPL